MAFESQPDKAGDVWCEITLENVGEDYISLPIYMEPVYWLWVTVRDGGGRELSYMGPRIKVMYPNAKLPLAPGYVWGRRLNLTKAFKMKPGRYRVLVEYGNPPGGDGLVIGPLKAPEAEVVQP